MRSDRDKTPDAEREIEEFLSKFEDPADELSADYSSYLNEKNTTKMTAARTFHWQQIEAFEAEADQSGIESENVNESVPADESAPAPDTDDVKENVEPYKKKKKKKSDPAASEEKQDYSVSLTPKSQNVWILRGTNRC